MNSTELKNDLHSAVIEREHADGAANSADCTPPTVDGRQQQKTTRKSSTSPKPAARAAERSAKGELRPPVGMVAGAMFGFASAVLYTMANVALRYCVGIDPFLVSAVKAGPTVVVLGPFLAWMYFRGERIATSRKMVPRFIVAALIGQFIGNAAFQISLGMIGLAVAVPITLGTMIIGGAILGRLLLHEPVRLQTGIAMAVLIAAVVVLSIPTDAAVVSHQSSTHPEPDGSFKIIVGSIFAAASGAAYSFFGVVMRQALIGGLSAPLTMFISGAVGTLSLWMTTLFRLGPVALAGVASADWMVMIAAGVFNFSAFVALSASLKSLPVVAVNLINASQVAMAAIAGILLFTEPVTGTLVLGIALTFAGLAILANKKRPVAKA